MNRTRIAWVIAATAIAAFGFGGAAYAFHDGGVAECAGCHSMHSSPAPEYLLQQADASSVCLNCHQDSADTGPTRYHISTAASSMTALTDIPLERTPGGDFGWLRNDLTATASYYAPIFNNGEDRGHNIVATGNELESDGTIIEAFDYIADTTPTAPGGTMPSADLGCANCHDPHSRARRDSIGTISYPPSVGTYDPIVDPGSYGEVPAAGSAVGVYRLLGGKQYQAFESGPNFNGIPVAVVSSDYNRSEGVTQTRVAYGHGTTGEEASWGKWCATCHPDMHDGTSPNIVHKVDSALGGMAAVYNKYLKTGDLSGTGSGVGANVYTSLVPFAENTNDEAALLLNAVTDDSKMQGPAGTDRLLCLTCHRAHASAWKYALRWNGEAEFLTLGDPATPVYPGTNAGLGNQGQFNQGYTTEQMQAAYYDRPPTVFAGHQRSLCNKCHNKD